jgi:pSer/pThr/pTyr-binding forkhead associated (FHA) protein
VLSSRGRTDSIRSEASGLARGQNDSAAAKLVLERGGRVGKEFPITGAETNIGRWDADSGIFPDVDLDQDDPEAKVSRRHARIVVHNSQYFIEDLGSTNGTFINRGRRLLPGHRQMLQSGDEIIVGKTFLKFHLIK